MCHGARKSSKRAIRPHERDRTRACVAGRVDVDDRIVPAAQSPCPLVKREISPVAPTAARRSAMSCRTRSRPPAARRRRRDRSAARRRKPRNACSSIDLSLAITGPSPRSARGRLDRGGRPRGRQAPAPGKLLAQLPQWLDESRHGAGAQRQQRPQSTIERDRGTATRTSYACCRMSGTASLSAA